MFDGGVAKCDFVMSIKWVYNGKEFRVIFNKVHDVMHDLIDNFIVYSVNE